MEEANRESSAMILQVSSQDQWYQHHLGDFSCCCGHTLTEETKVKQSLLSV